jgi:YHS domain-containing protein
MSQPQNVSIFFLISLMLIVLSSELDARQSDPAPLQQSTDFAAHDARQCSLDGVALGGYDVVAYHKQNKAVFGNAEITYSLDELTYQFSSTENRSLFESEPSKYLPHFRGWCAIALASNRLTCPDYKNFKIENGRLLLFETIAFVNGRSVWDSDPLSNLTKAERNYSRLVPQPID